ncbi:MAG TPA: hypothetical protein VHL51_03025 [Gaiellales bacterium]|jgi:hypothetical protein|nr:hypothetical protein [Gaiellales bacterium]
MRGAKYHGGFDHPVRSFVIGVTLLVLLFGGFVIGVEAGTHPLEQTAVTRIVGSQGSVHAVTVQPVVSTVINGRTRFIPVSSTRTRVVVIHRNGKTIIAYEPAPGSTAASGPDSAAPPTLYTMPTTTVTVTEPGTTVTEPPVTVTVTEPGTTTDTSATSNVSTSSP